MERELNNTAVNTSSKHQLADDVTVKSVTFTVAAVDNVNSQSINYVVNTLYIFVGLLGVAANAFVITVIAFHQPLRKRLPNYFLINQCFLDLTMALALLFTIALAMNNAVGPLPALFCYVVQSRLIFTSTLMASVWNLATMAFERYMEIVHPIRHKLSLTRRKVLVALVGVWLIGFGSKTWLLAWATTYVNGVCTVAQYPSVSAARFAAVFNILADFLIPLASITFCYIEMARAVRNRGSQLSKASVNILKILVFISVAFLICIGPRDVYVFMQIFCYMSPLTFNVPVLICLMLNASSCWINPVIYMWKYDEFHKGLHALAAHCGYRCCKLSNVVIPAPTNVPVPNFTLSSVEAT